jgi:hypothetical protein
MPTVMTLPRCFCVTLLLSACFLSTSGCGGNGERVVAVTGRVTHKDNPVAHIVVSFVPKDQTLTGVSTGTTDEDGRYSLTVVKTGQRGAIVGTHKVWVSLPREAPPPAGGERENERNKKKTPTRKTPPADLSATLKRYGSLERTPLSVEVTGGQPVDLKLD